VKISHFPYLVPFIALSLAAAASTASAAGQPNGETIFRQRCQNCHSADAHRAAPLGPNLAGVVGRKAASTAFKYSPALQRSGITWTRANLDRFLTAPVRMVPGTRMVISLPDPAQRAAVIDYLAGRR
jgi:cytochrome c